jgi:hypothetical protein
MPTHVLYTVLAAALLARSAFAQSDSATATITPLASKHFAYPSGIPYQVDPTDGVRGPQQGYNICNSTTEGPNSLCQTMFVDSIDDFCLWAPPTGPETIGDTEGYEVAWCTKAGRGTRIIPEGALQGVQFMRTPDYVQVVGFIDQTQINLMANDSGGELDPHGADLRGNPLGGLMYSNAFPSNDGNNNTFQQVIEWHNFMGGNIFCIKACDPAGPNAADFCQHIYDRIGCLYNAPNDAQNGTFTSCDGDDQDYPGIYTSNGVVMTYTQPPESLGAISTMPYQPRVPASSNCVTFASSALYTDAAAVATSTAKASGSQQTGLLPSVTATGTGAKVTGSSTGSAPAAGSTDSGAGALGISLLSSVFGVGFAVTFLA